MVKLTKRCIWFILICGIACTLGVNPVFADSDQTTDGEFGGVSAANEVSYEYDSTINEKYKSSESTEDDYTDKNDDIFSITMDEIQGCESFSEVDPEDAVNDSCALSDEEEPKHSSGDSGEISCDTSPDKFTEADDLIAKDFSDTDESQEIDGYSGTTKSSCDIGTDSDIAVSETLDTALDATLDITLDTTDDQSSETDPLSCVRHDALPDAGTADTQVTLETTDIAADSGPAEEILVGASPTPLKTFYNVVTDFGVNGNDSAPDEGKLRDAMYQAGMAAQHFQQMIEVFVPKGTYHLRDSLFIFSNIWLHLADGAVMYRDDPSKLMLLGVYLDPNGNIVHSENCKVGGYNQIKNVKVSGGEWNGGVKSTDVYNNKYSQMDMVFRHGENITIENTTIGNDTSIHSVNFDGCRNLTINNVKFVNHYKYQGSDSSYYVNGSKTSNASFAYKEALHTDYLSTEDKGSNAKPIENLGMPNVQVTNCTFQNVVSGVGTHHTPNGVYADGYKIVGCTFLDVPYICINAFNFRDFVCKENTAQGVNCFLQGVNLYAWKNGAAYIINNTVNGKKFNGVAPYAAIEIRDNSNVLIMNNTFGNIQADGVKLTVSNQNYRTSGYRMKAEVMQNLFYDGVGKAGGNTNYAAVRALPGVMLTTWKNNMFLGGGSGSTKIYGIYLNNCSDNCKLSTDYISGAMTGIYANALHNLIIKQSEVLKSRETGIYAANIDGLLITGTKILCGLGNGLHITGSKRVSNVSSLSLWNNGKNLLLMNLYNANDVASFATFMATTTVTSGIKLPCIYYKLGDLNFDGQTNKADFDILSRMVHGKEAMTPAEMYIADMNKDNVVDHRDIALLRSALHI